VSGGFVKLYGSLLLGSSLMEEAVETRWLFLCLAAAADEHGFVRCQTVGNAARLANLTHDQAAAALDALSSPDPRSTTPDEDGRRIVAAPGGWRVVNHGKYREMRTERQEKKADRQRRWRGGKASHVDAVDAPRDAVDARRCEVSASASPSAVVSVEGGGGGGIRLPGNPLMAGRRPTVESDGYRLIREINALEPDRDPLDILMDAAGYETKDGRFRTKVRLETMTDDHLARTIRDLRAHLAAAKENHGTEAAK